MNDVLCGNLLQWSGAFQLQLPIRIVWGCVFKNTALWICSRSAKSEPLELGFGVNDFTNPSHSDVWLALESIGLEMESF